MAPEQVEMSEQNKKRLKGVMAKVQLDMNQEPLDFPPE